jgi:hypothetical protein
MTVQQLIDRIRTLSAWQPVTDSFECKLSEMGMWDFEREALQYLDQRDHWLGWLSEYGGPGAYDRKGGKGRDAKYAYNHINCPPMLLWLGEAAGVPRPLVDNAMNGAIENGSSYPAQCRIIREIIPWTEVEKALA